MLGLWVCACNFESPLSGLWVGQILTLTILEAGKSKVKVQADPVPSEDLLPSS